MSLTIEDIERLMKERSERIKRLVAEVENEAYEQAAQVAEKGVHFLPTEEWMKEHPGEEEYKTDLNEYNRAVAQEIRKLKGK